MELFVSKMRQPSGSAIGWGYSEPYYLFAETEEGRLFCVCEANEILHKTALEYIAEHRIK